MSKPEDSAMSQNDDNPSDLSSWELPRELKSFEARLSALSPRDDRLDRERLAFLAGQASVIHDSDRPTKVLGLRLGSRGWPTAFAGMTVVAASLLVALVMQPDAAKHPTSFVNRALNEAAPPASELADGRAVLTARDAQWGDVEVRLAQLAADRVNSRELPPSSDDRDVPVLTPNSWQRVIGEGKPLAPSPSGASNDSQYRGVNS
jgi:hypothetical protein